MKKIHGEVKVHDKHQFELKYTYPIHGSEKILNYMVECFIFIPGNIGIDANNFSSRKFYDNSKNYIRLKTPVFPLREACRENSLPLTKLKKSAEKLQKKPEDRRAKKKFIYLIKVFCSIMKSAIRDEAVAIKFNSSENLCRDKIQDFADECARCARTFRKIMKELDDVGLDNKTRKMIDFADEYISLLQEKYAGRLLFNMKKKCKCSTDACEKVLCGIIAAENAYREEHLYPSIANEKSKNETYVYRLGILKKIMGSILYLRTRTQTEGRLLEHIIMGLGAGLAMAFATAFIFISRKQFEDFTISLFWLFVIIYIIKDRMKEISRGFVYAKIKRRIYDFKIFLYTNFGEKIGVCRESFCFLNEKKLQSDITRVRNKDYITELDNGYAGENVLLTKRNIKIYTEHCKELLKDFNVDGINNIIRFNIHDFLEKMDDPQKSLCIVENDSWKKVKASRVYHINLLLRHTMASQQEIHRYRLILDRNGIKALNEVPLNQA